MKNLVKRGKGKSVSLKWGAIGLAIAMVLGVGITAQAIVTDAGDLANVEAVHGGVIEHCDGAGVADFEAAFHCGDELFEFRYNAVDGVGANVGDGSRYTRIPRADLKGPGQWANHFPARATGPNSASCNGCHDQPADDGAGAGEKNAIRDPFHTGKIRKTIQRNTPHVFGSAALQVLAEEMNEQLQEIVDNAIAKACPDDRNLRHTVVKPLKSKGVNFGSVEVIARKNGKCPRKVDLNVKGVDKDLVVKPFQWKGSEAFLRGFNRGASHNELGMQPVETTGDDVDGDGDGVVNEFSIDDQTAMTVYVAAQPRPVTRKELTRVFNALDPNDPDRLLFPVPLTADQIAAIDSGEEIFSDIGCTKCHKPQLLIKNPIFSEPSLNDNYRDVGSFPAGQEALGDEDRIQFDLTADHLDNIFFEGTPDEVRLGSFQTDDQGRAIVRLFGDLKRHYMGPKLAENIDEAGTGAAVWMTKELWGVGSTDQYLHDGRATTLTEAILEHGGEAAAAKRKFERRLSLADQQDLIAFLNNLVLFKP